MQTALQLLHLIERVVLAQGSRPEVDVLAEKFGRADERYALRPRSSLRRSDLPGHGGVIGIAEEHEDPVEGADYDLASTKRPDRMDAVALLAQLQDLGYVTPPSLYR